MFTLPVTLVAAAVGGLLAALCGWRGARPPDLQRGPRLAPWRFMMLLACAWTLFMLVHAANLLGLQTGSGR